MNQHIERDDEEPEPIDWDAEEERRGREIDRAYEANLEREIRKAYDN